jgi:hypothetical protein
MGLFNALLVAFRSRKNLTRRQQRDNQVKAPMMNWKVLGFYLTLLLFLVTSWEAALVASFRLIGFANSDLPSKRLTVDFDWHHWHPVFASLAASPPNATYLLPVGPLQEELSAAIV